MKSVLMTLAALGIEAACVGQAWAAQSGSGLVPSEAGLLLHAAKVVVGISCLDVVIRFILKLGQRVSVRTSPPRDRAAVLKRAGRRPLPHRYCRRILERREFRRPGSLRGEVRPLKTLEIPS